MGGDSTKCTQCIANKFLKWSGGLNVATSCVVNCTYDNYGTGGS